MYINSTIAPITEDCKPETCSYIGESYPWVISGKIDEEVLLKCVGTDKAAYSFDEEKGLTALCNSDVFGIAKSMNILDKIGRRLSVYGIRMYPGGIDVEQPKNARHNRKTKETESEQLQQTDNA